MTHFLRGYRGLRITGAEPVRCLNRFAEQALAFWRVRQPDPLHLELRIYPKDYSKAEQAALRAMCTVEPLDEGGLPSLIRPLKKRRILLIGVLLSALLALFLQNFIWVVRIEGNKTIPEQTIRHALTEEGVGFGSWGPGISGPLLRMRMQLRLPTIDWMAANRSGGVLTVIVEERQNADTAPKENGPANIVASRAGIIRSVSTLGGTAAVEVGDAVLTGQLLISGITTWESGSQLTRACGEVYALTCRQITVKMPQQRLEKQETGRTEHALYLIFGRNRRKIFGNSSISHTGCDKIVNREVCTLPGGDFLPLILEQVEYREYEIREAPIDERTAREALERFAVRTVRSQMIAGRVLQTHFELTKEQGCYVLRGELSCEEMISKTVPISILGEDEANGEIHQRGEN